ncbi:MAG: hypothetical protein ACPG6R_11885 [Aequoribacter sp.]
MRKRVPYPDEVKAAKQTGDKPAPKAPQESFKERVQRIIKEMTKED